MKKVLLAMVMAALVTAISVQAEEAAAPAVPVVPAAPAVSPAPAVEAPVKAVVKKERPPAQDLELVGKVVQIEKIRKNKEGAEVKHTIVALDMTADGIQVTLPVNKKDGVDPITFVGKDVKVFAKGVTEVNKKGKKSIYIQKLVKIEAIAP